MCTTGLRFYVEVYILCISDVALSREKSLEFIPIFIRCGEQKRIRQQGGVVGGGGWGSGTSDLSFFSTEESTSAIFTCMDKISKVSMSGFFHLGETTKIHGTISGFLAYRWHRKRIHHGFAHLFGIKGYNSGFHAFLGGKLESHAHLKIFSTRWSNYKDSTSGSFLPGLLSVILNFDGCCVLV
jgi:hypothetical protein